MQKIVLLAASFKIGTSLTFTDICKAFEKYSQKLS